ncbi:MAG TPA: SPOR domain-containing protein [Desulfuromonadaceae bacterium]
MKRELIPEADGDRSVGGAKGSSQRLLLLVLLLLVVVFGYLYYFTGLIRPREEAAKTPEAQTAKVKQPLPPRPDQGGATAVAPAQPEEKPQPQAKAEPAAPAQPQAKPAPAATAKPAAAPVAKPAAPPAAKPLPPVQAKAEPAAGVKPAAAPGAKSKAVAAQPSPVKVAKAGAPAAKKEQAAPHAVPAQQAKPRQKGEAKPAMKTVAAKKTPETAKAAGHAAKPAAGKGSYTLLIGEFAIDGDVRNDKAKLKKLGVSQVQGKRAQRPVTMHRLFLAEFDSHYAADQELQKLAKATGSAFILEEKGKFSVYAGSYLRQKGAASEQKRLAGKGFKLGIKTAKVMMPLTRLTAGSFASSADAEKEASRLKGHGIRAKVVKAGA